MPHLNEKQRRLAAAIEARELGYGGMSAVAKAIGMSRPTIHKAMKELEDPRMEEGVRVRSLGGGRKKISVQQPGLLRKLKWLVGSSTRGDPMSPLLWTCKSTRELANALTQSSYPVHHTTVAELLWGLGYSLQANMKTLEEGADHPDRDRQFQYINAQARKYLRAGDPVISVDTKKKELVGNYHNKGKEWRSRGRPEKVQGHDFIDADVPKAIPYGIYDIAQNRGWVSVGCDHDTASFAMASIQGWWRSTGSKEYPRVRRLLICADAGGSNGYRLRLWKVELQKFVNETRIPVTVCHFPPGTSKWNKIEHRLFSHITMNWRARPLVSHEVIVKLIGSTKTKTGLRVTARLDQEKYPLKVKVSDQDMQSLNIEPHTFHGEWNYTVKVSGNL